MSQARRLAALDAERALLQAEVEYLEKKNSGKLTTDDKLALRALREDYRLNYRQKPAGGGVQVENIGGKAKAG